MQYGGDGEARDRMGRSIRPSSRASRNARAGPGKCCYLADCPGCVVVPVGYRDRWATLAEAHVSWAAAGNSVMGVKCTMARL